MNTTFWHKKRVMVTGGSGFCGRWLVRTLAETKAQIHICDISPPFNLDVDYTYQNLDLSDIDATIKSLHEFQPEVMIHLAGQAGVSDCHKNPVEALERNVLCTFSVLEACRVYGKLESIVAASSNHVYGEQEAMPSAEDVPLNGFGMYATSKLCGDVLARSYGKTYGLPVTIARITNSYGGDDSHTGHIITGSILSILRGITPVIRQSGRDSKGFLYIKDTVDGFLTLAEKTAKSEAIYGEAFNFAPDNKITVKNLVQEIISLMDEEIKPEIQHPMADYEIEHLDNRKARQLLGWTPKYSLRDGLSETIEWYRQHGV